MSAEVHPVARRWWTPFKQAADDMPPLGDEAALATMIGAACVALTNAIAIEVVVPFHPPVGPGPGLGLRLMHHFFAALEVLAVAGWLALPLWLWARSKRGQELGWPLYAVLSSAGMYGILWINLQRQASSVLDGRFYAFLYPIYVLMCGVAVPAGYFVGGYLARLAARMSHWFRWLAALLAVVAMGVSHYILPDDYPGVHAAILWVSMCAFGSGWASWLRDKLSPRAQQRLAITCAILALAGVAWAPPNGVRQQIFRENGSSASWVLAQVVWRAPSVTPLAPVTPPVAQPLDDASFASAREGVPDDALVVLLTIDAFRGDVLQNHDNDTRFLRLDWLRDNGANFTRASSPGSQTSVSLGSMFAGRYFSQLHWELFGEGTSRFLYPASDTTVRWPQLLTDAGVHTECVLGLNFLKSPFGLARGFAKEQLVVQGRAHAMAQVIMTPLIERIRDHRGGPALFFAHLMEPHQPYDRGQLKTGTDWERYLSEIEEVDRWVHKLVTTLQRHHRRTGYLIVSSDHGEAFGEHGTRYHTKTLYEELLHVPLLVWGPGIPRRTISSRVGLIDVGPTVLHLFGQRPPEGYAGESLLPLMRLDDAAPQRRVFAEGRLRRAYYPDDRLKIIEDRVHKVVEVYDLDADPEELHNLFDGSDPEIARAVAEQRAWFDAHALKRDGYAPPYKP